MGNGIINEASRNVVDKRDAKVEVYSTPAEDTEGSIVRAVKSAANLAVGTAGSLSVATGAANIAGDITAQTANVSLLTRDLTGTGLIGNAARATRVGGNLLLRAAGLGGLPESVSDTLKGVETGDNIALSVLETVPKEDISGIVVSAVTNPVNGVQEYVEKSAENSRIAAQSTDAAANTIDELRQVANVVEAENPTKKESKVTSVTRGGGQGSRMTNLQIVSTPRYDDVMDAIGASVETGISSVTSDINSGVTPKRNLRSSLQVLPTSSGGESVFITDFFLTDIREEDAEKFQIVETFGSNYIFFFGRKPLIYVANGILYNSENYQWKNNFKDSYNRLLRGTQLVKARSRVIFMYEDVVREGYILNFSHQLQAQNPHAVPFSFSMFVTREFDARPGGRG
jgi:hypothetical protein